MTLAIKLLSHEYLDRRDIPDERREFPTSTDKGAAGVARALGFEEGQLVKTLIFETGAGEAVLVLVGGDRSAVSGKLKRAVGSRDVGLASPEGAYSSGGPSTRVEPTACGGLSLIGYEPSI